MANKAIHADMEFHVGDTIQVHYKLIEKETVSGKAKKEKHEEVRERIQIFEGIVISIRGEKENTSFTVRRIGASNIGIERIFPLQSPWIKKITVKKYARVRRAKLYYLRKKEGKEQEKIKEKVSEQMPKKQRKKENQAVKKEEVKKTIRKTSKKTKLPQNKKET